MQHIFVVGDEPVPGYRLLEELEGTAFFKVWRVSTPEGHQRWWKVIDLVVGNAAVETRTLGLLVRLRHPFINTLTNFWNLDDGKTLIIETDVPKVSLREVLLQKQRGGEQGLSFEETLTYISSAAEGLDFLNRPQHEYNGQMVAIHHRALRPESLLLFEDADQTVCRVSDFGLSKPVTDEVAAHSQGLMHYDYDPPEFFEGQTSPTSDQFSLGIVYYELRTGKMPFRGTMLEQLQARLNDKPDLSALPEPERSIIRKALARDPHARFRSSADFVRHLRDGINPATETPGTTGRSGRGGGTDDGFRSANGLDGEVTVPRPTTANLQTPGWRSTAAAMQGTPIDSTLSVTLTPPPRSNRTFQRPRADGLPASDSSLLTPSPNPTLTPPPGIRISPGRPIPLPPRPVEQTQASIQETQPTLIGVQQTIPTPKVRPRPVPMGVDLKSIREHLASTSMASVDSFTGEKKIPLTWVAVILAVTAMGTVWISNHFVP
jgi:serine/threonine protein kinase